MDKDKSILVGDIITICKNISDVQIEELIRKNELGESFSFVGNQELFEDIFSIISYTQSLSFRGVPTKSLSKLKDNLSRLKEAMFGIRHFDASKGITTTDKNILINSLEKSFQEVYSSITMMLVDKNLNSFNIDENKLYNELSSTVEQANNYLREIENLLEATKKAASETVISKHGKIFSDESDAHNKIANKWLFTIILVLLFTFSVGVSLLFFKPESYDNNFYLIQITITKVVVITGLFYALSICIKNYKANRHNQILNKHRQNALNTFEAFVKSSGEDSTIKNAILLEVSHTIFSNQQTGYLNNDNDSDSPNKIIEIIKNTNTREL